METSRDRHLRFEFLMLAVCLAFLICSSRGAEIGGEETKLFIVYLGQNSHPTISATIASHHDILSPVCGSKDGALKALVHHYKHAFSGFSALLTQCQAQALSDLDEVVSVFESRQLTARTTRSFSYLGLRPTTGLWPNSSFGKDVIIGVIDGGIWPESESFNDDGLSPVPARWNGTCVAGEQFEPKTHCNRKVIGARWYIEGLEAFFSARNETVGTVVRSARDTEGHGTHTSSTAAGSPVANVSFLGLASGIASGGAPAARIAAYKVLWNGVGHEADILAAFDQAILDGVDIISISIGSSDRPFHADPVAIGAYHATERGILVSIAAGNSGPASFTAINAAPWMLTVAASTSDRRFHADIELGDGTTIQGVAVNTEEVQEVAFPLVDAASIPAANSTSNESRFCREGSLNTEWVTGKIVVCETFADRIETMLMVRYVAEAGAAGVIVVGPPSVYSSDSGNPFARLQKATFNSTILSVAISERSALDSYLQLSSSPWTRNCSPTAIIRKSRSILTGERNSVIALFSSRGPNIIANDIFKPDLTAPGVDILAAWSGSDTAKIVGRDGVTMERTTYNMISGTSMSTPQVSGVSALIKSRHPDWSPAAIKSALMTSARPLRSGTMLDYGAGEINPEGAADPGLVYDLTIEDYILFLCGQKYNSTQFELVTGKPISVCPNKTSSLNYPSISFSTVATESSVVRTVTNVGPAVSTYNVTIVQPGHDLQISVSPSTLAFTKSNQKLSFVVSARITTPREAITPASGDEVEHFQGSITWTDSTAQHRVHSPVSLWNYPV